MIFYLIILLRISPSNQSILLDVKEECKTYQDENTDFQDQEYYYYSFFYCGEEYNTIKFIKCSYCNCKMISSPHSYFIHSDSAHMYIQHCNFVNIEYNDELIYFETNKGIFGDDSDRPDVHFSMNSNTISNCNKNGGEAVIVLSEGKTNDIQNNSIYFDPKIELGRAFQFLFHRGCVFKNNHITNAKYDDGCGVYFDKMGPGTTNLHISDSTFSNCKGDFGGTFYLPEVDFDLVLTNLEFELCKNCYSDESSDMISIEFSIPSPKLELKGCRFSYIESNSNGGSGIGLMANKLKELIFDNTVFEHIYYMHSTLGGGAICIDKNFSDRQANVEVKGCKFLNVSTSSKSGGGAIYFNSEYNSISIKDSKFINTVSPFDGHSIYIVESNANPIEISSCYFEDCGSKQDTYSILVNSFNFNFLYNEVVFSDPKVSCGCVKSTEITKHIFKGNVFRNAHIDKSIWSAGINAQKENGQIDTIELTNNTFDCITGQYEGRCFRVNTGTSIENLKINNNTIQNCPSGGALSNIILNADFSSFIVQDFVFINNTFDDDAFVNNLDLSKQILVSFVWEKNANLVFDHCSFINCYSTKHGGGLSYKNADFNKNVKFEFNQCRFENNHAKEQGSALSITSSIECEINGWEFIKNKSVGGKGALYIESGEQITTSPIINVNSCVFDDNEGENAGLNVNSNPNTQLSIANNSFLNCGQTGFIVAVETSIALCSIKQSKIEFTNSNGCGGISIKSQGEIEVTETQIIGASSNTGLLIQSTSDSNKITINQCVFDSCSGTNFDCFEISIQSDLLTFKNNIVQNVNSKFSKRYIGLINFIEQKVNFELNNISFINNSCSNLFNSVLGLQFCGINKLIFKECAFQKNEIHHYKSNNNGYHSYNYFNDSRDEIKLSCIDNIIDIKITFNSCKFIRNSAFRNGDMTAIPNKGNVVITKCFIENNNVYKYSFDSTNKILLENHINMSESIVKIESNSNSSCNESSIIKNIVITLNESLLIENNQNVIESKQVSYINKLKKIISSNNDEITVNDSNQNEANAKNSYTAYINIKILLISGMAILILMMKILLIFIIKHRNTNYKSICEENHEIEEFF